MITVGLFALFGGLWRAWLGGLWQRYTWASATWLKYAVALAAVWALTFEAGHYGLAALVLGVTFIGFFRFYGHGPMLRYPLGYAPKDKLYRLVYGLIELSPGEQVTSGEDKGPKAALRWWVYALIRYGLAAWIVTGVILAIKLAGIWIEPNNETDAFVVGIGVGFTYPRVTDVPVVLAAGILVPVVYWIAAAYGDHFNTEWLAKLGGISRVEFLETAGWPHNHDHNEYPHHYAEMIGGAIFAGLFAASLL